MKEWIGIIILALVALYIGNAIGLSILCETVPKFKRAKKYVWFAPALTILFFIQLVFDKDLEEKWRFIWEFVRLPNKNILTLSAIAFVCEEERNRRYITQKCNTPPNPQRIRGHQAVKSGLEKVEEIFSYRSRMAI